MRDSDRRLRAGHAAEEDRRRLQHFDHREARLELFRLVARELGPVLGARDDGLQAAHHLAAVADAEREGVAALEEAGELVRQLRVEQDGLRPALARTQHIAIREAADGNQAAELIERGAAGDQVAHVHVHRIEAGLVHHVRSLDMRVHALLAQDRDLRFRRQVQERRGHIFQSIERELRRHARVVRIQQSVVFLIDAGRVVAQARDAPAGFAPQALELGAILLVDHLRVARELDHVALVQLADDVAAGAEAVLAQHIHHVRLLLGAHLQHRTQLFREQRAQRQVIAARLDLAGPVLRITPVGRVLAFGDENVEVDGHAGTAGKAHLGQRCVQAAVGTVVIREHLLFAVQSLHRIEEGLQVVRAVDVRHAVADLLHHLRQRRCAHAVLAAAQVDEDQRGLAEVTAQLRRQRAAHVIHRRKGRHDQRHRRHHGLRAFVILPGGAHRQRILADRDRQAERRAQFHADGLHGIEQRRILPRLAAGGHPVGRQLDVDDVGDRRSGDVGQRLADGHAARGRCVDHGQRRALAHGHRLADVADMAHRGHRAIGNRHLPRARHLVTHRVRADGTVADGDQEGFVRDRGQLQYALGSVGQRDVGQVDSVRFLRDARDVAMHLRRLAEQDIHRHVDRIVVMLRIEHAQLALFGGDANNGERATLALAQFAEQRQAGRRDAEHVALLRFVAPDFLRRQAAFLELDLAQVEHGAAAGVIGQFGEGIRQAAGADVMDRQHRVLGAHGPARIDDFLRTTLHFRVAALDRVEIEVGGVRAGRHRRGCTTTHADAHAGAAELDQQAADRQLFLLCVQRRDVAQAAGDHDRLVVAVHGAADVLLKGTEIAGQVGTPEFIVERGAAERAVDHDLQRRRDAVRLAGDLRVAVAGAFSLQLVRVARVFPRLHRVRDHQVGDGEARKAGLRLRAAAGRAFVADLAAGAGGRARERRDRRRVVVRLDLHQDVRQLFRRTVAQALPGARIEAHHVRALDHRRIVGIRDDGALRLQLVRIANHREQRAVLLLAVDGPVGVEDLVAAVLAVGLREHHQLDIGRVAAGLREGIEQVVDLVIRQRQAEFAVGGHQRSAAAGQHVDVGQRLRVQLVEQRRRLLRVADHDLGHAVMQQRSDFGGRRVVQRLRLAQQAGLALHVIRNAALDPVDLRHAAVVRDVGRLAGPRRDRAEARDHDELLAVGRSFERLAIGEHGSQAFALGVAEFGWAVNEMAEAAGDARDRRLDGLQLGQESLDTKCRQGAGARENEHG